MVTETVMDDAHGPGVVYVTEYAPSVLDARLICPVLLLTNTNPAGDDVNVPPATPVMVGVGSAPDWQYVLAEYENVESWSAVIVIGDVDVDVHPETVAVLVTV